LRKWAVRPGLSDHFPKILSGTTGCDGSSRRSSGGGSINSSFGAEHAVATRAPALVGRIVIDLWGVGVAAGAAAAAAASAASVRAQRWVWWGQGQSDHPPSRSLPHSRRVITTGV
jgi:hypothetical protein